jgi:hypothetical protein
MLASGRRTDVGEIKVNGIRRGVKLHGLNKARAYMP